MSQPAIQVHDLVKFYERRGKPPVKAVQGISFTVRKGEIFGLLGPNGAGKTTTLRILTTLLPPTAGSVAVLGHDVVQEPLEVRKNICVVLQENAVELYLSVRNNFRTFGKFHNLPRKELDRRMDRIAEHFGLGEFMNAKGVDLSGGQKRRIQVAKMFLVDKPIVFLDEATTGMDTFNKRTTIAAIKEEVTRGRTVVLTTHILDEAEELCDSLAIVNHGRLIAHGSIEQVKAMGLKLLYVWLDFKVLRKKNLQMFRKWKPLKMDISGSSVELTVKDERTALAVVGAARRTNQLRNFEIVNATLEDVFMELIDKGSDEES